MSARDTGLGTYVAAIARLRADAATAEQIAHLLGIHVPGPTAVVETPAASRPAPARGALPRRPHPEAPPDDELPPAAAAAASGSGAAAGGDVHVLRIADATRPAAPPLPILGAAPPFAAVPLPFEPLLRPVTARAVVTAAIATRRPGRRLDVPRAVAAISRRRPLSPIPRLSEPAVPGAVRVVVDHGPGVALFDRDASDLCERIAAVAGRDRTAVVHVAQSPLWRDGAEEEPFPYPPPGSVVIALSDVGIAAPTTARATGDWLALAAALRARGCRLVAFVPYPSSRWSARLASAVPIITWDRPTGAAHVKRALRAARGAR